MFANQGSPKVRVLGFPPVGADRSGGPTVVFGSTPMTRPLPATRASASTAIRAIPLLLRVILKVRDGAGGGYWWVECGTCEHGWQVPHYPRPVCA
jgi:hypothetical protein